MTMSRWEWTMSDQVLQPGETFTVQGIYARRTFWQWLTRAPRQLQVYTVTEVTSSDVGQVGFFG